MALNRWTLGTAIAAARALAPVRPGAARLLYARIFQRLKRQAVSRERFLPDHLA
jgi:hypothetical protein